MAIGVYCLDVGQGQCVALIGPSPGGHQAALIDLGADGVRLGRWLKGIGVTRIPLIVLTHNHDDHIKGLTALVEAFAGHVGGVKFVVDQPPERIPYWIPIQDWLRNGKIGTADVVCSSATARPGDGKPLLEPSLDAFQLYCIYPTVFEAEAVASGAPVVGIHPGKSENAVSAIVRLVRTSDPDRSIFLFGGDLTFKGWQRIDESGFDLRAEVLIVPHHGSNSGSTVAFGADHLASKVAPTYALLSVGTNNTYGHPRKEVVNALRGVGSKVLCTQVTDRCVSRPGMLQGRAVRPPDQAEPNLESTGVRCAGTIVVAVPDIGPPEVLRLNEHQDAVDRLPRAPVCPLCRS